MEPGEFWMVYAGVFAFLLCIMPGKAKRDRELREKFHLDIDR